MHKRYFISAIIAVCCMALFFSCEESDFVKGENEQQSDSFGIDEDDSTQIIEALGGLFKVTINTSIDFNIKYEDINKEAITWIEHDKTSDIKGTKSSILKFIVKPNDQVNDRIGDIILSDGVIFDTVRVTQSRVGSTALSAEVKAFESISLDAKFELTSSATYKWSVVKSPSATTFPIYSLANSTQEQPLFIAATTGVYKLKFVAKEEDKSFHCDVTITVKEPTVVPSPYISKVLDFVQAPGQFTNMMPEYEDGNSKADIIEKIEKLIVGEKDAALISLGGFGGYITFGFDHTIINVEGKRDVRIIGNAFYNNSTVSKGGSCEPGIVMVAYDANKNGVADDNEWYEIAGSEYLKPTTIKDYEITYFRPLSEETIIYDDAPLTAIKDYIRWEDNQGNSGYKAKNTFYLQSYFPGWISEDKITFKGTLLPNNAVDASGEGSDWVLSAYGYGYADNALNREDDSAIDINWAVDKSGNNIELPGIDFMKIYTGVNQEIGWLGEVSTDISGVYDMHLSGEVINTIE